MRRKRRKTFGAISVLLALITFWHLSWPILVQIADDSFLETQKCPACYGRSLCPSVYSGRLTLTNYTRFTLVQKMFNAKNVYFGLLDDHEVVVKKLAHDHELAYLDKSLCNLADRQSNCVGSLTSKWTKGKTLHYHFTKALNVAETFKCVRNQDMIDFLAQKAHDTSQENFLTLALVNPEPLIASTFPSEEGWPFPKYYGSCGRISVFERVAFPLANHLTSPWTKRARLSLQVLHLALKMTTNEPLSLYLTDWSLDNFSVSQSLEVKLIDLENIILVNKTVVRNTKAPGWNIEHHSVAFLCEKHDEDCFSYSIEDLCSHVVSDHNIYGACQGVLKHLLRNIPHETKKTFPMLERLISECAWPSHPGGRLEAAHQLVEILKQI